jgi:dUTP pyrophosphatase
MVGLVFMRSSIADVAMTNGVGVIDSDYRGQIMLKLRNTGNATAMYSKGERIAQLVLVPFVPLPIEEVEHLPETARGDGGFGSTGR